MTLVVFVVTCVYFIYAFYPYFVTLPHTHTHTHMNVLNFNIPVVVFIQIKFYFVLLTNHRQGSLNLLRCLKSSVNPPPVPVTVYGLFI